MKKLGVLFVSIIMSIAFIGCGKTTKLPVTLDDIKNASEVINEVAVVSELKEAKSLCKNDQQVFLKLENTQPINSFKLRGAYYMISKLSEEELAKGLCTCSAGNHAQGVGLAAENLGCEATIYVPDSTPEVKLERIRAYKNVTLKIIEGGFDDAKKACLADVEATGKIFVPPYDDKDVIAGQGTVGLEIMEQLPDADAVVIPVGGGGLASGIAIAVKAINPDCRIYVVEPENAASMKASIEAGKPVELASADTIADGTAVKKPGDITYEICSTLCDGFFTVSEDEIKAAIAHLYIEEGITTEGAGALATAAVMTGKIPSDCKKVVSVVSGSNIDPDLLMEIVDEAEAVKKVKVLIVPKFEIGDMTDDTPGEAQNYFTQYLKDGEAFEVAGLKETQRLYYKNGIAMVVTGYGKVNASASLCAVLADNRFDFSESYILDVGCCGGAYEYSVMGDVNIVTAACDYDLGHRAGLEEMENKNSETRWFFDEEYAESGCYKLNPELMDKVYELTKDVTLETTTEEYMARAFDNAGWATRKPKVTRCSSVTSDTYWKGMTGHKDAVLITTVYDCSDPFGASEMEDTGIAGVAKRFGMLDRLIIIRDVVNMDVFMDGATPESLWDPEAVKESQMPESGEEVQELFTTSMHNNFKVGKIVVDAILAGELEVEF